MLQIYHNRGGAGMSIHQSLVELEVETRNFEHIREIEAALDAGWLSDGRGKAEG